MKKKMLTLLSLLVICFISCSDDDNPGGGTSSDVIKEVKAQFETDYPNATNVVWNVTKDNFAVAQYNLPNASPTKEATTERQYKTWYKNEKEYAKIKYMEEKDIKYEALPEAVRKSFEALKYADKTIWKIDDVEIINRYNLEPIYSIEVESKEMEVDLYFDQQGILFREIIDLEDDYEKHNNLIISENIPAEIKAYLDKNHNGFKILDIDIENDDLDEIEGKGKVKHWEIEFVEKGVKKEIIFSFDPIKWLYTEWEVKNVELPAAILNTLSKDFADYELDDNEYDIFIHNAKGTLYKVELDYKGNEKKKDLNVYFDDKGTVILKVED